MHFQKNAGTTARGPIRRLLASAMIAGALLGSATAVFSDTSETPVGVWQTIDDRTHQPAALVQITQNGDGTLSGRIVRGLGENNSPDRRCTACTDERKNQKIQGMTIVREMKPDGDAWDAGKILDPTDGKEYRCKMHLEAAGKKLVVRGYIGVSLLGRSQTWMRHSDLTGASPPN